MAAGGTILLGPAAVLDGVLHLVHERGWFDTTRPFETSIHFTQGACLWLLLTRGGVSDTYVKFSRHIRLETEARRFAEASRCHPQLAPRFVGHAHSQGLDVLACKAVEYRAVGAADAAMLAGLGQYFQAMPSVRLPADLTPLPNAQLPNALAKYFGSQAPQTAVTRWLEGPALLEATSLPDMPQHGDFVVNNLGQRAAGTAVVFDWEDFGAVGLPGLDLFTLELSLAGDAARLLEARSRGADRAQQFAREACASLRLDWNLYLALAPVYALVFRYLKSNYGPGVRERYDRVLAVFSDRASG